MIRVGTEMRFAWLLLIARTAAAGDALELEPMTGPVAKLPTQPAMKTKSGALLSFTDNVAALVGHHVLKLR